MFLFRRIIVYRESVIFWGWGGGFKISGGGDSRIKLGRFMILGVRGLLRDGDSW